MSFRFPGIRGVIYGSLLGLLALGCKAVPPSPMDYEEEENIEETVLRTEMMKHRARVEPKTGVLIPVNGDFEIADLSSPVIGVKGSFEAIQKGMFFGLEFNYAHFETKNPLQPSQSGPLEAAELDALPTESLFESFDQYKLLFTWDYDIPLGTSLYSPIFRIGVGLGAVGIDPTEAPGNTLREFNQEFTFVGRPTIGFRFPFHEHIGAFIEANYDFIPEIQMTGKTLDENVNIGDNKVNFSTGNIWFGLSFEW